MQTVKARFLHYLAGSLISAGAAAAFLCFSSPASALVFTAMAAALAALCARYHSEYRAARLISENPILSVGMASVAENGGGQSSVRTVVSGFGILLDGRPYKFGHGGVELTSALIDRESVTLCFGGEGKSYSVRLLHGLTGKEDISLFAARLRYETGVNATISG